MNTVLYFLLNVRITDIRLVFALSVALAIVIAGTTRARNLPVWRVGSSSASGITSATAQGWKPVPGQIAYTAWSNALAGVCTLTEPGQANALAWFEVEGEGTERIRIRW